MANFVSNFPEALVGSASMRAQGRSQTFILGTWAICAVLLTLAVVDAGPLASSSPETISLPLAFAAGAVLASLADTLMPETYEKGGPTVALSTTAGFVLSYVLGRSDERYPVQLKVNWNLVRVRKAQQSPHPTP